MSSWLAKEVLHPSPRHGQPQIAGEASTTMIVGSLRVRLLIREARSLKDKRQIVRSVQDRLRSRFQVAVAEVDELNHHQLCELGIAFTSNDPGHARGVLTKIVEFLRGHPIAELLDHEIVVLRQ